MMGLKVEWLFPAHPLTEHCPSSLQLAVDGGRANVPTAGELVDQGVTNLVVKADHFRGPEGEESLVVVQRREPGRLEGQHVARR